MFKVPARYRQPIQNHTVKSVKLRVLLIAKVSVTERFGYRKCFVWRYFLFSSLFNPPLVETIEFYSTLLSFELSRDLWSGFKVILTCDKSHPRWSMPTCADFYCGVSRSWHIHRYLHTRRFFAWLCMPGVSGFKALFPDVFFRGFLSRGILKGSCTTERCHYRSDCYSLVGLCRS